MVTLTINNSLCQITGITATQEKELRNILSYQDNPQAQFFGGYKRQGRRYLIDKKGNFPTGLLYLVEEYLGSASYARNDLRRVPQPRQALFTLSMPYPPYPEQKLAGEAPRASNAKGRGILVAPTGTGKTVICALIINNLQVPTLVVVPSLELKHQVTASLKEMFGDAAVGGKGRNIWVANVDSLDPKTPATGYDCVIIDEFHRSGAKTYRELNKKAWAGIYYKIGLTATPFRSQDHERLLLESVLSKVIYRIDYHEAVKANYIAPLEAYYLELPKTKVKGDTWAQVYSELVVHNEYRNNLISRLLTSLALAKASTLCLVKEIAHGEALSGGGSIPFANGLNEATRGLIDDFNARAIDVLIGTTGVLGEGVDSKPCEYVIIAGLGKSKNAFMQQCGRAFRRYPGKESAKVILIKDPSHKFTLTHFKAQVKILKDEYGVTPVRIEI